MAAPRQAITIPRPQTQVAVPQVPRPTVPMPAPVVPMPQVPAPTPAPLVPKPQVPTPIVPTPTPQVPRPTIPTPQVPTPQVPRPTIPTPQVPTPTVPEAQVRVPIELIPAPTPKSPIVVPTPGGGRSPDQPAQQPRTVTTTPQGGGILRQFGARVTTVTTGAAVAAPTVTIVTETADRILTRLVEVWNGTPNDVPQLLTLQYADGTPIIDIRRRDIIMEIVGMLTKQSLDEVIDFLIEAPNPEFILWEQNALDEGRTKVAREIAIQQAEEVGVRGVGKCKYCPSTELVYAMKQLRSGDEPATIFVRCVMCQKQWRQ